MKKKNQSHRMRIHWIRFCILLIVAGISGVVIYRKPSYAAWQQQEDGSVYYEDENGQIAVGFQEIDGKRYYFDDNGYLQTGKFYVKEKDAYYFSDDQGVLAVGGIIPTEDGFYAVDAEGKIQTGFVDYEGARYYFDSTATIVKGWYKAEDNWYYADENGKMCTGLLSIDGARYYFGTDGICVRNTTLDLDGVTYVFNADGSVDENATVLYPVYQSINTIRTQNGLPELQRDGKVQACAIIRATSLTDGFEESMAGTLENLLKNRGVSCKNGYEFSYGGIESYDTERLIQDMTKDSRLQEALRDASVTTVGIGVYQQDAVGYYDIILISQ
ncbi:MAG: hypothetical protein PUC55_02380 [Lachnospiraceae bacterium]|nr:hypothetical protein [Lachnospiraceae bacterium]